MQKTLVFSSLNVNRVNRTGDFRLDASGKGVNVARVLTQLGREAAVLTAADLEMRELFLRLCRDDGLRVEWVPSGSAIRFCYTVINRSSGEITELVEDPEPVVPGAEEALLALYDRLLPDFDCLVISGSHARGFSGNLYPEMVRRAREAGKFVVLDIRGAELLDCLPFRPEVVKPNLEEFCETFGEDLTTKDTKDTKVKTRVMDKCGELYEKYGCVTILTRGAGAVWYYNGEQAGEVAVSAVPAVNSVGSGDAFTAGFVSVLRQAQDTGWREKAALEAAIAEGSRCGALNAGLLKVGGIR
jgi:1-phosphofructokinase/tagatose 6-phosphate kinase